MDYLSERRSKMYRCDYCLEKIDEDYDIKFCGEDEKGEWHDCCLWCGNGYWLYLEDNKGNVLIERDGELHRFDPDHYTDFIYGDYEDDSD
jgi:hypothetical protein